MSFRHNFIVDYWLFGKFIVKYEIAFFTRGILIEGYIDTASIDEIVTSFLSNSESPIPILPVMLEQL